MTMHRRPLLRRGAMRAAFGFTLVELLISMTIGLVLMAALGIMMNAFDKSKRQSATTSDLAQNSGYLSYDLDRQLRSIGSGLFQNQALSFGCPLDVARNGAPILPRQSAFPAPFQNVPGAVAAMPIVVYAGLGFDAKFGNGPSDVIQIMTTSAGMSEAPQEVVTGTVQVNAFNMNNTLGLRGGDLLMLTELSRRCLITQVAPNFVGSAAPGVPLDGPYYAAAVGTNNLVSYGVSSPLSVTNLGNVNGNQPHFQLIGINDKRQLVAYDMLQMNNIPNADLPVPLADNVIDFRVRFGVAPAGNGVITSWVNPSAAPYNAAGLTATPALGADIVAVSISMLVRGDRIERDKEYVSPGTFTMFSALPAAMQTTIKLPEAEQLRHYRLIELTVPVRNAILTAPARPVPP
ncbi:type IV pilus assembly protein PilW [Mitsuaria sp. BK045]|uniref:PilW family protein n=1 Tax=unclassified Roseateles TaxID=2626991 RepID=UPI00160D93C3|nr:MULTISPECIES: PilW family protein [unclassified Roseateles]MBB3364340.1 type IV pilus assembly protein PilW [Mitsuaria sp. BK045]